MSRSKVGVHSPFSAALLVLALSIMTMGAEGNSASVVDYLSAKK